tara:strand:+ start:576 stop:1610 length:1035 start_codon:yes stop_codon:yes gene_type:complete
MINRKDLSKYIIDYKSSLIDAIRKINKNKQKFLAVTKNKKLIGTITDGDIRRALLKKKLLKSSISDVYNKKPYFVKKLDFEKVQFNLKNKKLLHCPVLSSKNKLIDIIFLEEKKMIRPNKVVIMAGGLGKRLLPYTKKIPKPLIKIDGKPMLERIIFQLKKYGLNKIYLSLNYKSHLIEKYFGDGKKFQVSIKYLKEKKKMGTAGSLSLLSEKINDPLLVMNCDIITELDFKKLIEYYEKNRADALMCVKEYAFQVPYGVVNLDKISLKSIDEKPVQKFFVNAGIYLINPKEIKLIPQNKFFDMPELFKILSKKNKKIVAYPVTENWSDAGSFEELKKFNVNLN